MTLWIRAALSGCAAALLAGACGGDTGTVATPVPICAVYYGGGVIPDPPPGASLCPSGVCNYEAQTGCGAKQMCWPQIDAKKGTVTPVCRTAGTAKHGEPCKDATACGPGLFCADGTCHTLCCGGDWSACSAGESCIRQAAVEFDDAQVPADFDLCYPVGTCNLLDPTACASERRVCRIVDPTGAVACAPNSDLKEGDPCDYDHQCGQGLLCAASLAPDATIFTNGTCRKLCRFGNCVPSSCDNAGDECVHFNRDPSGIGECTPNWDGPPTIDLGTLDGGSSLDAGADASH